MAKSTLAKIAIAAALTANFTDGSLLGRDLPFRVGVTPAKPHDEERKRKAEERRARRQAARPKARI